MIAENLEIQPGLVKRHESWDEITAISTVGRQTMASIPTYKLYKAATQCDVSAPTRLLLVHLLGYLGIDNIDKPQSRFVVFPGNTRLADERRCTSRSIQRQADELEAAGLIRRCYNGLNRRTGFDLTPFAMQHEQVIADIVAVQTKRRQDFERAQLELSLEASRIERPSFATSMSSQGDAGVTLNNPKRNYTVGVDSEISSILTGIDQRAFASTGSYLDGFKDRTGEFRDAMLLSITSRFTGGGRATHLGWGRALHVLGKDLAVSLYLIADNDPKRQATTERYFAWLLQLIGKPPGVDAIKVAAERASKAIACRISKPRKPQTTAYQFSKGQGQRKPAPARAIGVVLPAMPNLSISQADKGAESNPAPDQDGEHTDLFAALRMNMGQAIYNAWIAHLKVEKVQDNLIRLTTTSSFTASWVESNLLDEMQRILSAHRKAKTVIVIRSVK